MGNTFSRCTQQHTSLYAQHHWYGRNPKDKDLLHQQFVGDYLPKNLRLLGRTWCDGVECWGAHGWIPSEMNREWGARIYFHRLLRRMKTKPYWRLKKKRCFAAKNVLEVLVETSFFNHPCCFPPLILVVFFLICFCLGWSNSGRLDIKDGKSESWWNLGEWFGDAPEKRKHRRDRRLSETQSWQWPWFFEFGLV